MVYGVRSTHTQLATDCFMLCCFVLTRRSATRQQLPSLAARYLEKKTRRFFDFFAPPPSCFPGFTRG